LEPAPKATDDRTAARRFESQADAPDPGLLREFLDFLRHNKKWWLAPLIVVLLLVGVLVILGTTAAGPFIYTLF
jgi:hypothetical protein